MATYVVDSITPNQATREARVIVRQLKPGLSDSGSSSVELSPQRVVFHQEGRTRNSFYTPTGQTTVQSVEDYFKGPVYLRSPQGAIVAMRFELNAQPVVKDTSPAWA